MLRAWRHWQAARLAARSSAVGLGAPVAGCGTDAGLPTESRQDERDAMVSSQIESRGIDDELVLDAMWRVPRHEFAPAAWHSRAYDDRPLSIGWGQTISQPFIVAFMTAALELRGGAKVLEIGTGSGYQAAVLAALGCTVYSIEIVEPLARSADATLRRLGCDVHVRAGDGYRGWPEAAPFDAIVVTAAPELMPLPLVDQLAVGGRLVLPVGGYEQRLVRLRKTAAGVQRTELLPVRFVPMTGEVRGDR